MKKICFLMLIEKFTSGFISFVKSNFGEYDFNFLLCDNKEYEYIIEENTNNVNIYVLNSYLELSKKTYKNILNDSDIIVISGLFNIEQLTVLLKKSILNKTYIQLWGGDFYCLSDNSSVRRKISNLIRKHLITNAAGIVNLISGDFKELCKLLNGRYPKGKHFIAPVCSNNNGYSNISEYLKIEKSLDVTRIIVGNSASVSNQHFEALSWLSAYKDEKIEIYCPLSYGNKEYKNKVILYGESIFGTKFHPIINFMSKSEYTQFLAQMNIGIFNNNRQQAMGNIGLLLGLGAKVYIRSDTAMWDKFAFDDQMRIFDCLSLPGLLYDDFKKISKNDIDNNYQMYIKTRTVENYVRQWKTVFDSDV